MNEIQNLANNLKSMQTINRNIQTMVKAKGLVQNIINSFKKLEKQTKKTKQSRKAMRLMEDFVRCNVTDPAIFEKYGKIVSMLGEYNNVDTK